MQSKWLVFVGVFAFLGMSAVAVENVLAGDKETGYTKVEIKGTLEVEGGYIGVKVNPGVRDGSYAWELNFSKNPKLRKEAEKLKGKTVVVAGEIRLVGGTLDNDGNYAGNRPFAPHQRHAVFVSDLKEAKKEK